MCTNLTAESRLGLPRTTAKSDPGVDHSVGIERDAVDSLLEQPLGEIGMITGTLSADPDVPSTALQALIALLIRDFTAGSRSSNVAATKLESRSSPSVS